MRRSAKWMLVLGVLALPFPAQAQYYYPAQYYNQPPAYYYAPPRPAYYPYYAPNYGYAYPAPNYSYSYARPYPAPSYGAPPQSYPSTSYYTTARPMPTSPPTYYSSPQPGPQTEVAPPTIPAPMPSNVTPPPPVIETPGDNEAPPAPGSVIHKGKINPDTIFFQPPAHPQQYPSVLPAPCASCKPGVGDETVAPPMGCPTGGCPQDCKKEKRCHFDVFGDYLFWKVRGADLPFAQAYSGIDPLAVPRGPVGIDQASYNSGFRAGAGISLSDCSWIVGTFTYFDDLTTSELGATGGNVLHALLVHPNTVNAAPDSLKATSNYDIRLIMGDIDYKCAFVNNEHFLVNWLVGARYAHLEQGSHTDYAILGTTTVDTHVNFDGIGLRAGFEGEYKVKWGVFGYARGIVDLLGGHFQGSYTQRNVFAGLQAETTIGEDRLVPILELEAGVGWMSQNGRLRVSAGYYVGSWFNTVTTPSFVQGVQNSGTGTNTNFTTNGDNFRDNLTFDGFVGRLEFRY